MGGRGGSGARSAGGGGGNGAFGKENPITVTSEKRMSSGGKWTREILEASDDGKGNITLSSAGGAKYEKLNNNTTKATYELKQGVYGYNNSGGVVSHNINWENVKSISGQTFNIKDFIKSQGFNWDNANKRWTKS